MRKVLSVVTCLSLSFVLVGCKGTKKGSITKPNPKTEYVFDGKGSSEESVYSTYDEITSMLDKYSKDVVIYDTLGRKIHEISYTNRNGESVMNFKEDYEYDEDGKLIREYMFLETTQTYSKSEYTYDEKGREILKMGYLLEDGKWSNLLKYESTYDSNNNLKTKITSLALKKSGKFKYSDKMEYTYNSNNQVTSEVSYGANYKGDGWNSTPNYRNTYTYDENDRLIRKFYDYITSGGMFEYVYDSNNNLIEVTSCSGTDYDNRPFSKEIYTYDSNNNKTSHVECIYDSELKDFVPLRKREMTYDSNNNILTKVSSRYNSETNEEELVEKETYSYNDQGKKTKVVDYYYEETTSKWVLRGETDVTYKTYE